jgi:hypothetical protein
MSQEYSLWTAIKAYIAALWHHALGIVGGGALVICIGVWERWANKNVPWGVYVAVMILGTLTATFRAWEDQYRKAIESEASTEQVVIEPWYSEADPICAQRCAEPGHNHGVDSVRFRVGLINLGKTRIDNVRATCGTTSPLTTIVNTSFFTFPDQKETFSIPLSVGPAKPSTFLNVAFAEVIDSTETFIDGRPGDIWTRYTIGFQDNSQGTDGSVIDREPRFWLVLRLECPTRTIEIPCVIWREDRSCRFVLADDVPAASSASVVKPPALTDS